MSCPTPNCIECGDMMYTCTKCNVGYALINFPSLFYYGFQQCLSTSTNCKSTIPESGLCSECNDGHQKMIAPDGMWACVKPSNSNFLIYLLAFLTTLLALICIIGYHFFRMWSAKRKIQFEKLEKLKEKKTPPNKDGAGPDKKPVNVESFGEIPSAVHRPHSIEIVKQQNFNGAPETPKLRDRDKNKKLSTTNIKNPNLPSTPLV